MTLQGGATLRRASHVDAPRVALARATSFGTRAAQPGLAESASAILAEHLALGDFACWVVEIDDEIVSFGVGMVHQRLPAEHNPSGRWGYIQSMETHPAYRRRGYATAILRALQDWCRGLGLPSASLVASRAGEPLYRQHGFAEERFGTSLIWFVDDGVGTGSHEGS